MATEVTLGEVARRAGVSPATASRALNGRDGVKPDVRDRVQLVADALGYRPNRAARILAGGRTAIIGLILGARDFGNDAYSAALVKSVAQAANRHDEALMLVPDSASPNTAVTNLISDGLIDGVIVTAVAAGQHWVEELIDAQMPTVLIGSQPRQSNLCVVDVENLHSAAQLVGHMLDNGRRRIATITGPLDRLDAANRLAGWEKAHTDRGIEPDPDLVIHGTFSRTSGYEATAELLVRRVDGVFAANDEMAMGLFEGLTEEGIVIPDDLALAGFDGTGRIGLAAPTLSSVETPFDRIAEAAVSSLIAIVSGASPEPLQLITPAIHYGGTTM